MFAEEWPLLMFTLFMQLAVGTYIFFVIIRFMGNKVEPNKNLEATRIGMILVGPIIAIALILSLFHLGTPFEAYRSIGNLGSSWLSREILFSGLFFALWLVGFVLEKKGKWSQTLGWINSAVGLLVVFAMASIYSTSVLPAWSSPNTYFSFFGTTILLGAVASIIMVLLSKVEKSDRIISTLKGIGIVAIATIILQLIYLPIYSSSIAASGTAGYESLKLLSGNYLYTTIIRWVLSVLGISAVVYGLFRETIKAKMYQYFYVALAFVFVGEFMGRYLFYATGIPVFVG